MYRYLVTLYSHNIHNLALTWSYEEAIEVIKQDAATRYPDFTLEDFQTNNLKTRHPIDEYTSVIVNIDSDTYGIRVF